MRAHEFISEVIDVVAPPNVDWSSSPTGKEVLANWKDKSGVEIRTVFTKISPGVADVAFARKDAEGKFSFTRTGTGKELSANIFGGVASNIKEYLAKNPDITHITFGASDDPARARLYAKMSQRASILGLEPVSPTDKAALPPEYARLQRDMKKARTHSQILNQIPTLSKTPAGTPTLAKDQTYSKKYDQFMLKRISAPTAPSSGGGSSRLPVPTKPAITPKLVMPRIRGGGSAPIISPKDMDPAYHKRHGDHINPIQIDPLNKRRF